MMKEKKELDLNAAKEKALRLLEFRSHSEKELCDKLIAGGAKSEDLPEITDFLREFGLLNDASYAVRLAKDLKHLKKYGKRRILSELRARGISAEDAQAALSELDDDSAEELLPLVEKKLGGNFERKNIDRAVRYFLYRGYGIDDIKTCIESLKSDCTDE